MDARADGNRRMPARSGRLPAPGRASLIALALGAAAVLAVGAMGLGMARLLREQAFADAERNMGNLAHALAAQTSQAMQTLDVTFSAQLDAHLDEYARASGIAIPDRLQTILGSMPMLHNLALGDADGRIVHAAPKSPAPDAAIAGPDTLQALRHGATRRLVFDRPSRESGDRNPPLRLVRALRTPDGSLTGAIGGDLDPGYFTRFFGSLRLSEGGAITLLRDDAVVMMRVPAVPGAVGTSLADGVAVRATLTVERDGVVRHVSRLDGQQRITAIWRVPDQPLYVAVSLPEAVITASWQQSMRTGAIGVGVLTGTLMLLGAVAYRAVRRRESVEERLHADAGRYRLLFERNPDPMWMFDQGSGAILDVNAAAVAAYGYAPDEFLRMNMSDLRGPEAIGRAGADRLWDQAAGDRRARRHHRKDGSVFDVEVSHDSFELDGRIVGLALARDVSARIAAERRLADFLAASADWMWETDADHRMIWLSPNIEQILGVSPGSHYGRRREDLIAPGTDPAGFAAHQADVAARRPFKGFEYLRETPSGPRWVRTSGVPYFDADGTFLGYRGVGQDITDLKTIQARLIDAIESIPAGVRLLDADDRVVLENARNRAMLPRADTSIESGGHFEDILRELIDHGEIPAAQDDPERWIAERLAAHRNPGDPIPITYADGHTLEIHERRLRDGGYIVLRFDITARLEAERRLAESEARYRLLFQRNPDPIWVFDRASLAFLEVNEAAIRTYGFSREEFRQLTLKDIRPPEDVPALLAAHQGWDGGPARQGRWRHRRRDGSTFEVEISHDLLTIDGRECVMSQVRDVSARAAAERRLQDFMNASADWLWEADQSLRFVWTSPNFEQSAAASDSYRDLRQIGRSDSPYASDVAASYLRAIDAHQPFKDFEFPIDGPQGQRWLRVSGVPYFDGGETFLGYRGVGRDITDIKLAQARLIDAIESIPAGVVVLDRDDRVVMTNARNRVLSEASDARPLLGMRFVDILRELAARGGIADAADDPNRWIAWRLAVHRDPGPPIVIRLEGGRAVEIYERRMSDGGSILLRFDVTDRLRAEERLAASEARLKAAMDATVDGIIMIAADGRIVTVNKSAENLFGYAEAELVGRNVSILMPDPYQSEHDRYLASYLHTREAKVIGIGREVRGLRKDGSEFALDLAVAELPREVGAGRFIGTVRDITQRKQLDMQLREAQKMQALGQLTGGIAHDFNNLLAVISLNLESAAPRVAGDRLLKEMIELSLQAAGRGAELTNRLLAFARRQPLMPRPLDLGAELRELGRLLQRIMPEQISVQIETGGEAIAAELDGAQLQNALLNLALNARDAMPKGGRLTISLAATRIYEHEIDWPDPVPTGDYAVISVHDTGEGIAPDIIYRVLDPFFTTKPAGQGTGLGLSMVYGFARQSGGWLQIESEAGAGRAAAGATIRLLFPRSTAMPQARAPDAAEATEVPHRRILLVEDYDDLRRSLAAMLRLLDCEVVATADAEAALAVLDGPERFDGLITDIGLPGAIDGWKLARLALARRPGLKIITMSGHADPTEPEASDRPWSGPHLPKPFQRADMAAALKAVFGGGPARSG